MVLKELLVELGFQVNEGGLKKVEDKLGNLKKGLLSFAEVFASAFVFHETKALVDETALAVVQLARLATTFGMTTTEVENLQFAAQQTGVDVEQLRTGLSHLTLAATSASQGNAEAQKSFTSLGVRLHDAHGKLKPVNQLFGEAADKIKAIKNPTEQVGAAIKIFGRGGAVLVPLLKKGSDGIKAYEEDIKHLGAEMSEGFVEDSKKYVAEQARHSLATEGLHRIITKALLPAFTKLEHIFAESIGWINRLLQNSRAVEAAFALLGAAAIALAVYMALPFLPYLGMALLVIASIAAIILIVDDLWVALDGGDSVLVKIGQAWTDFITSFTKDDSSDNWLLRVLKFYLRSIFDIQGTFLTVVDTIKTAFMGFFGWLGDNLSALGGKLKDLIPSAVWDIAARVSGGMSTGSSGTMPAPSGGAGAMVNSAPTVNVTVNAGALTDPNALVQDTARVVDERLAAHAQDMFNMLTPTLAP